MPYFASFCMPFLMEQKNGTNDNRIIMQIHDVLWWWVWHFECIYASPTWLFSFVLFIQKKSSCDNLAGKLLMAWSYFFLLPIPMMNLWTAPTTCVPSTHFLLLTAVRQHFVFHKLSSILCTLYVLIWHWKIQFTSLGFSDNCEKSLTCFHSPYALGAIS